LAGAVWGLLLITEEDRRSGTGKAAITADFRPCTK
jgi:hypothetical protein